MNAASMEHLLLSRRRGSGKPGPPTGSLQLWLDATKITGLNDADPVSAWNGRSPTTINATQAGGLRPTYRTNVQNGLPVVRFASASAQHFALSAVLGSPNSCTFYMVAKVSSVANFRGILGGPTGALMHRIEQTTGRQRFGNVNTTDAAVSNTGVGTTLFRVIGVSYDGAAATYILDGGTDGAVAFSDVLTGCTRLGVYDTAASFPFEGDIAEVLGYTVVHGAPERALVQNYLRTKWNV
jgi:hypothetical protein